MVPNFLFTSESVTEGHPDKIADQTADSILDSVMGQDPNGRVACETLVTNGLVLVAGEITTAGYVDVPSIVRRTIEGAGYTDAAYGFDYESCGVVTAIQEQSPDISQGVETGGAGDQGMMFGYATRETVELMPLPIVLAHKLVRRLAEVRKNGMLDYLRPDGKSQVTVEYDGGKPKRVEAVVIAAHHSPEVKTAKLQAEVREQVIGEVVPKELLDNNTKYHINATGRFEVGGPRADTGMTGRKIICDTYGGVGSHGGGCFSGKDPTKVDRSGSYFARYVAKNVVASGLADVCELQVAYAIGVADPVSLMIETQGTGQVDNEKLLHVVKEVFDFKPRAIIKRLDLRRPIFKQTAAYGHFGREEQGFTWERTDAAQQLKKVAGI